MCGRWLELCSAYLPLAEPGSIWRYNRLLSSGDPRQGWKIHVSATVLTANDTLEKIAPLLQRRGPMFKAPISLQELNRINAGIYYGYTQIGKVITVYPRDDEELIFLAECLHDLTAGMIAPAVPFDLRLHPDSCIYYRYGGFERLEIEDPDGRRLLAIRDPNGRLVPDLRDTEMARPDWVSDPFAARRRDLSAPPLVTPLQTTYRAFQALTQRGKGGVYRAYDLSRTPPRLCILKEGRRGGEVGWDGRDGVWRVRHEERVLRSLSAAGIAAPRVYSSFEAEQNYYLVTECLRGETLQSFLHRRRRRLPVSVGIRYARRLATLLSRIHSTGWAWRDCKPTNLIISRRGELRPLDFEGACPVDQPDPSPWGTPGFIPPEFREDPAAGRVESRVPEDLYALGALIYLLLTGEIPDSENFRPLRKLRRGVPAAICDLVSELLSPVPHERPAAQSVAERLARAFHG